MSRKPEITEQMIQDEMTRQARGDIDPPDIIQRVKVVYSVWPIALGVLVGNLMTGVVFWIVWILANL